MASANYPACLREVLKHEGGYSDHPHDRGGPTMYGITQAVARENGYFGDMRHMPMSVAEQIYRPKYWDAVGGNALAAGVDLAVFDFAVNSGPPRARAYYARVAGGPPVDVIKALCAARLAFVKALATWATFGRGWTRRIVSIEAVGVKMALAAAGKPSDQVRRELRKEGAAAGGQVKKDAGKAAGTAGAGGASQAPQSPAQVDWALDWALVPKLAIAIIVIGAFVYFARKAIINRMRSQAYAEAAKPDAGDGSADGPGGSPPIYGVKE